MNYDTGNDDSECRRCGTSLHLNEETEWPDDDIPLFCWACQHEEIKDLVTLARRGSRALKANGVAVKLASQIDGYLKRHGYRASILRDEK